MKHGEDVDIDELMKDIANSKAKRSPPPYASPPRQQHSQGRQQPPEISTPTGQHQPVPTTESDQVEDSSHTSDNKQPEIQQIGEQDAPSESSPVAALKSEGPEQSDDVEKHKTIVERYTRQIAEQDQQIESLRKQLEVSALMSCICKINRIVLIASPVSDGKED